MLKRNDPTYTVSQTGINIEGTPLNLAAKDGAFTVSAHGNNHRPREVSRQFTLCNLDKALKNFKAQQAMTLEATK
ncbi:MAG: hypothetical protein R3E13_02265 [Alphaproteobacteria bacterium]